MNAELESCKAATRSGNSWTAQLAAGRKGKLALAGLPFENLGGNKTGKERVERRGETRMGKVREGETRVVAEGRRAIRRAEPDGETRAAEAGEDERKEKQWGRKKIVIKKREEEKVRWESGKAAQIWKSMKQYSSFKNSKARGNKHLAERNVSFPLPRLWEVWRLGRKAERSHFYFFSLCLFQWGKYFLENRYKNDVSSSRSREYWALFKAGHMEQDRFGTPQILLGDFLVRNGLMKFWSVWLILVACYFKEMRRGVRIRNKNGIACTKCQLSQNQTWPLWQHVEKGETALSMGQQLPEIPLFQLNYGIVSISVTKEAIFAQDWFW